MSADEAESIAWLMVVVVCVIGLAVVVASLIRHDPYGVYGTSVLMGFTGLYTWWLNRVVKRRNRPDKGQED